MLSDIQLTNYILTFILMLTRMSGLFVISPVFGFRNLPMQLKLFMAAGASFILFLTHPPSATEPIANSMWTLAVMGGTEFFIGFCIGFAAELVFTGVRMSGEYLSVQMGMSVASILDPITGNQSPLMGQIFYLFAFLLLMSLNLHHVFIIAVDKSLQFIPLGMPIDSLGILTERMLVMASDMFIIALQIAAPAMAILLVTEVALAFVAKVMPQMNIFIVSLPLKFAIGLMGIMASMPFLAKFLINHYTKLGEHLFGLFNNL